VSKLADGVRPRVPEPTPCKVPEEDGWLSNRHPPQELDLSLQAKKARQMQARHQPNGLALDPAKLPQHLYASTFPATIELVQAVTEHARECKGSFMPRASKCVTHGLAAAMTFECSKRRRCKWDPPDWRQYGAHADDNAFAADDGADVEACAVCNMGYCSATAAARASISHACSQH
jgi:hypothetical protein